MKFRYDFFAYLQTTSWLATKELQKANTSSRITTMLISSNK